jgi:hypothetical protein
MISLYKKLHLASKIEFRLDVYGKMTQMMIVTREKYDDDF